MAALPRLLLVGCGKMGQALLGGWLERAGVASVHIIEPALEAIPAELRNHALVRCAIDPAALPTDLQPDAIVVAVKPQMMSAVLPAYRSFAAAGTTVLSIAAGRTIASIKAALGGEAAVVRAMPNTPAAIGKGVSVLVAGPEVDHPARALCTGLMSAVGSVNWADSEDQLDAVTAMSGSGPAYVFLLAEALAQAGTAAGLPARMAVGLARETVIGAGALLEQSAEPAGTLRRNVTSPGGTTEAALEVLMRDGALDRLMEEAVAAAVRRARELSG
ncbi:MAG: pyrroline-5-carboxylate reductase [Alphaproteobacteria bacterium]|nr:pyrroline-5-carboxylate reductase [Alphaproteobacteria bacterium]